MRRAAFALVFALGCAQGQGPGVSPEAGVADAALPDAGAVADAAAWDGGEAVDAGSPDSSPRDAGARDVGSVDAGPSDAGPSDAGPLDAGPTACEVVGVSFTCEDVTTCSGTPLYDECGPEARNVCCVTQDACSVQGAPGVCLDVAACPGVSTPGRCPGPASIQCCTRPERACGLQDAPSLGAGLREVVEDARCPPGMVHAGAFCIDRYEASLEALDGTPWSPFTSPGSTPVRARSAAFAVPQAHISQVDAAAACGAAGKRLCTDAEWLAACRGADLQVYPYGEVRDPGRCNDARGRHPAYEYFGTTDPSVFSMLDHPCLNQLPAGLALTGEHAGCESPVGALDMMGNLHEWTADPAGTFRGGFYVDTEINGQGCLYRTTAHGVGYHDYSTGFRCCADLP